HLKEIEKKYGHKGLIIISVSLDDDVKKWKQALKEETPTWIQLADLKAQQEIVNLYGVRGIPAGFLIDKNGIVIGKSLSKGTLDAKLKEVFGERNVGYLFSFAKTKMGCSF
ncbi:MAG: TlpA family protein disulfide reductase, partial [Bacteroidia bacterium]